EMISRSSALHASRSQAASSAARVAATCSTAPPSPLAVYAQPPCTLTSSWASSADTSLAIMNAAAPAKNKATVPFNLKDFRFLRSRTLLRRISAPHKQVNPSTSPRQVECSAALGQQGCPTRSLRSPPRYPIQYPV